MLNFYFFIKNAQMYSYNFSNTSRIILNSIRRTILQSVPTFAFSQENIIIHTFKSNNLDPDIIRFRISTIPVPTLLSKKEFDSCLLSNSIKGITMKCSVQNELPEVRHVTTNDCTFDQPNPYKNKILICSLQQGERIDFTATAITGQGLNHAIFCPTSKCYFTETGKFVIHPRINYNGNKLLLDAINILKFKLKHINNFISIEKNKIIFLNDKFTLPMLLVDYLQDHKAIKYAGAKCNHLLESEGCIDYMCESKVENVLEEIIEKIKNDLDTFGTKLK